MYLEMCYVCLSACTSPQQTAFDSHMTGFAAIVDCAEIVMEHAASSPGGQMFTYEANVVTPPLLCAATKCRDPTLRRKALHLLRQAPQSGALWSWVAASSLVEEIIAVEEGTGSFAEDPFPSQISRLPLEEQRIHHVAVVRGTVVDGRRQLKVQLTKAAIDKNGSLKMVHKEVYIEDRMQSPNSKSATTMHV